MQNFQWNWLAFVIISSLVQRSQFYVVFLTALIRSDLFVFTFLPLPTSWKWIKRWIVHEQRQKGDESLSCSLSSFVFHTPVLFVCTSCFSSHIPNLIQLYRYMILLVYLPKGSCGCPMWLPAKLGHHGGISGQQQTYSGGSSWKPLHFTDPLLLYMRHWGLPICSVKLVQEEAIHTGAAHTDTEVGTASGHVGAI